MLRIRLINSLLLSVMLLANSWPITAAVAANQSPAESTPSRSLLENVGPLTENLTRLQQLIDRSQFDLEELLFTLDYDHEQIISYVKQEVGLDIYPGTLRGSKGTLMSRAGNALDQSILLAKLLKDAGLDARIARGNLTSDEARMLVNELRKPRPTHPPAIASENQQSAIHILQELGKLESGFGVEGGEFLFESPDISTFPNYEAVLTTANELNQKMQSTSMAMQRSDDSVLIEEAEDYFWVQYRLGPGEWQDAHPSFATEAPFEPKFTSIFADEIPPELHHKFSVQVFIETTNGRKLEVKPVSSKWERPIANLIAVPLVFANMPNTLMSSSEMVPNLREAVENASWFSPIFEGGLGPESEFFDKNGNIIDPMAAGDPAAGIFQEVNNLFGKAVGEIGEGGRPTLTAQWMEFKFTAPDGKVREHRRTVIDRVGPATRLAGELPAPPEPITTSELATLLQRHTFMISAGGTPQAMAIDTAIQGVLDSRAAVEQLLNAELENPQGGSDWSQALKSVPQYWTGHLSLFTLLDMGNDLTDGHLIYRSGPSLVIHTEGFSGADSFIRSIDIVQNPKRAVDLTAQPPTHNPAALIAAGVWETMHEGLALGASEHYLNTMIVFDRATESGATVNVFSPGTKSLEKLGVSSDTKTALQSDLDNGFAVIAPDIDQPNDFGWWRIDPKTGETLGQIADGRGGAVATEYLEGLALGISISLLAVGLIGCTKAYDPPTLADVGSARVALACCFLANAFLFAAGFVFKAVAHGMVWDAYWSQQSVCQD